MLVCNASLALLMALVTSYATLPHLSQNSTGRNNEVKLIPWIKRTAMRAAGCHVRSDRVSMTPCGFGLQRYKTHGDEMWHRRGI
jgi:hypothetical protein